MGEKTMICPRCGLEFQDQIKVCVDCGIPLVKGNGNSCPKCGRAMVPGKIRCVSCNAPFFPENEPGEVTEDVSIVNIEGNKICSIHCPQTWSHFTPYLRVTKKWTDAQNIILWAWHQAFETNTFYQENDISKLDLNTPASLCVICNAQSVKPVLVDGLFKSGVTGVQCENAKCNMYHVTIPLQMLLRIKEVPEEYIPKGFTVKRRSL